MCLAEELKDAGGSLLDVPCSLAPGDEEGLPLETQEAPGARSRG